MKEKILQLEQVDKYLSGLLNEQETEQLNLRMLEDEAFRKMVDDVEIIKEGIKKSGAKSSLETKLDLLDNTLLMDEPVEAALGQERHGEESKNNRSHQSTLGEFFGQYKLAIAASLTLLLVAYFALTTILSPSPTELFAENFEPYAYQNVTRGDVDITDKSAAAYAMYANGQYLEATTLFEALIPESQNVLRDKFYLGNAYLASGEAQKAITIFKEVIQESDSMKTLAQWYLGLSYLEANDADAAKAAFEQVEAAGEFHAEDAATILKKLD
jgi:TolA-binding protein